MNATIEEQGMLKILEHLHSLLFITKKITSRLITEKTGIESKYLRKLVSHGVIECGGSGKNTYYKWAAIRPNIYMAKEVLKDAADFTNSMNEEIGDGDHSSEDIGPYYQLEYKYYKDFQYAPIGHKPTLGWSIIWKILSKNDCDEFVKYYTENGWITQMIPAQRVRNIFIGWVSAKYPHADINNLYGLGNGELKPILPLKVTREERDSKINICSNAGFSQRQIADKLNTSVATVNRSIKKKNINVPFDEFWDIYDKKVDRDKCEKKWAKLSDTDRSQIMLKLPEYITSTPDKTFRRNPLKYLDTRSWEQELVKHVYFKDTPHVNTARSLSDYRDSELWEELKRRGYMGTITKALE